MENIDQVYQEIEKSLCNQSIDQNLLKNLELKIQEFKRKVNPPQQQENGLGESLLKKNSSVDATGEKLHEISLNDEDQVQDNHHQEQQQQQQQQCEQQQDIQKQITWLVDKQIQKIINLTSNDSGKFSKSYMSGRILLICFENDLIQIEQIENIRLLVNLVNSLCNIIDKLNGLELCFQLGAIINNMLNYLLKLPDLSIQYKDYMNSMKQNPIISGSRVALNFIQYEKKISQMAQSDDFQQKKQAVNLIFDLFSECISYSEQMTLFSYSITNILKDIVRIPVKLNDQEEQAKTLMVLLAKFVLTLLVIPENQIEFDPIILQQKIQMPGESKEGLNMPLEYFFYSKDNYPQIIQKQGTQTDRQQGNVINYQIRGIKEILAKSEHIYGNIALIVNSLLLFPNEPEIMRYCLSILRNLYKQFLTFRKQLETPIMTVLQNISNLKDQECIQYAANFLHELINTPSLQDEQFIDQLIQNEKISQLQASPFFDSKYVSSTLFNKQIFKFEDLVIHKTFATQQTIEAEKSFSYHLEIKKPYSIVYVGFATQTNDIKVTFQKLEDFGNTCEKRENQNVIRTFLSQRINCEQDPYRLVLLAESKGIYKIEFDNTYSWYNSKLLRFRCLILEPEISDSQILRKKLLFNLLKFDQMDLNLYKKFDGNWCQLYLLNHSIDIQIDTFDKQSLKKAITSVNFDELNQVVENKFQQFSQQDYFSILIIYEQSAWTELLNSYAWQLVSEGYHTQKEIDEKRMEKSFQLYLIQRFLQEHLTFLYQFKSLSLQVIEDTNYFWVKNGQNYLSDPSIDLTNISKQQQQQPQGQLSNQQDNILISKSNPTSKTFQLKIYHNNALHLIQLEELDDDIFEQYELLLKLSDSEEYFSIYCEFMKRFLVRHQNLSINKLIIYVDPSNMFWTEIQMKLLKNFFETQMPEGFKIPTLIKSSL
ncbi:hypothetical protein TTHERM_01337380 (macronuclear) [Tetrahymena thermophila SB210]|uniref:GOLD domain-containing protein n=1 Tax=Tetrahymena thermophila (strain SB210) TaxID=312017 RepID=Q229U2_TETTS|nr:hypothetical protein TTHERM_01337380 [Tetrahymena thermophila SB210]EAR82059.1 hypothetical protein TTHERM_01337380 [Tetrahymena thermophila SB210]|eukprot:XP_001029722.1 hypothetical protein TTHERM_01337380 [Tetrahymena thermophila SB210]